MLFIPNSSKLWLCLAPRNKCELSPPLPPSQAAGDIAPPAPGDRRGKSPTRKHPEGMAGDGSFVFSPSVKDVKPGNGPAASICKHVVNDPIFPSICSWSTCQHRRSGAGCSNGGGQGPQPGCDLDPAADSN